MDQDILLEKLMEKHSDELEEAFKPLIFRGVGIKEAKIGDVSLQMEVKEDMLNPLGKMHGGMSFTLCDTSAGLTTVSLGTITITLQSSINYLKPIRVGNIYTKNKVIHNGRTTKVIEVSIFNENNELAVTGVFTMYVVEEIAL